MSVPNLSLNNLDVSGKTKEGRITVSMTTNNLTALDTTSMKAKTYARAPSFDSILLSPTTKITEKLKEESKRLPANPIMYNMRQHHRISVLESGNSAITKITKSIS
jgi:hypothetical protein